MVILFNMAESKCSRAASSSLLLNGTGNKEEIVCERCCDREFQLKEVLNEISSAQMIINILQKELLLFQDHNNHMYRRPDFYKGTRQ